MCLAQGHNAVMPVRLEPAVLQSRVKRSTTEPLRSQPIFRDTEIHHYLEKSTCEPLKYTKGSPKLNVSNGEIGMQRANLDTARNEPFHDRPFHGQFPIIP